MNTEITVAIIYISGPIVTSLLTLLGISVQKNYRCGRGALREEEEHIVQEQEPIVPQEPIVDTESITLTPPRPTPLPVDEHISCQILSTELGSFLGIVRVNETKCFSNKKKCRLCNKYYCEYHFNINNTGDTGGHVCRS